MGEQHVNRLATKHRVNIGRQPRRARRDRGPQRKSVRVLPATDAENEPCDDHGRGGERVEYRYRPCSVERLHYDRGDGAGRAGRRVHQWRAARGRGRPISPPPAPYPHRMHAT